MERNNLLAMSSALIAFCFWVIFYKSEVSMIDYTDNKYSAPGNVLAPKYMLLLAAALIFTVSATWFYKRSSQTKSNV